MTQRYTFRCYNEGDAPGINRLYAEVTGIRRTLRQFEWQWLQAPGGKGDIWLIEAITAGGKAKLIGHHGIMPIRFSLGAQDLLFGKTENTLVHPDYRSKILYPRFERHFAAEYEPRFDALFSTRGPPAALRLRKALGYAFPSSWRNFKISVGRWSDLYHLFYSIRLHMHGQRRGRAQEPLEFSRSGLVDTDVTSKLSVRILDDERAKKDRFFSEFWPEARVNYGLTPRRDREDLNWRFWSNPYTSNITLVADRKGEDSGYVIISRSPTEKRAALLEDIVPHTPTPDAFCRLLGVARSWLAARRFKWLLFSTTDESCAPGKIADSLHKRNLKSVSLVERFRDISGARMPRKVTERGKLKSISLDDWYLTPIVFEGRTQGP